MLTKNAQATLLLTSYFSKSSLEEAKPLTITEWAKFAFWLREQGISPENLLTGNLSQDLKGWHDSKVTYERISKLLDRGHSMALAFEKWTRAGLWVLTRSDPGYPKRLKSRLKTNSPPVLYGCGNIDLLNCGGIAVVGSRNASETDLSVAKQFGHKAADAGVCIVSGASRGVDETAMLGAVNSNGKTIGVLSEDLYRVSISKMWRKSLLVGNAVLISPFYPEAGFSAANAMGRNKYIYCLADSSLVIHSGKKGGTIAGAEENIKNNWVPLWVSRTTDKDAANAELVAKGGRWLDVDIQTLKIADLISNEGSPLNQANEQMGDLFSMSEETESFFESESNPGSEAEPEKDVIEQEVESIVNEKQAKAEAKSELNVKSEDALSDSVDFYQLFTNQLQRLANEPITVDELIESSQLHKSQLTEWLKRAVDDEIVEKLNHPVRYQFKNRK